MGGDGTTSFKEANTGKGIKFPTCIRNYMLWVIPVVVAIIYLKGYYDMFQPKGKYLSDSMDDRGHRNADIGRMDRIRT